ncbi:MAG TPA: ElyC/SanA/YdcF family protein [Solimonas sp.]
MKPSTRRRVRRWALISIGVFALVILLGNRWVINSSDGYITDKWALLPDNDVGLVLGTSPFLISGKTSPAFQGRIDAAAELYRVGKVKHLIVSGANPDETYNEPRAMRKALMQAGVPEDAITMDFAGFRTFDSVVRAKQVFKLTRMTIVTQKYHSYRAVFIARKFDIPAYGFIAPANADGRPGNRHPMREVFARVSAILDIFVLNTKPKFLGAPEAVPLAPEAEGA